MADTGHVDANLMGAACLQPALHMGVLPETVQNPVMGYCILSVLVIDCLLYTSLGSAFDHGQYRTVHMARTGPGAVCRTCIRSPGYNG